jgi:hypothetical protein
MSKNQDGYEKDDKKKRITVLFCNACARHSAPSATISLKWIFNFVSDYMRR